MCEQTNEMPSIISMAKFFLITVRATNVQLQKSPKLRAPKLTISERQVSPSMKTQIFCRDGAPTVINGQRYGMTLCNNINLHCIKVELHLTHSHASCVFDLLLITKENI